MSFVLTGAAETPKQAWVDESTCQGCHPIQYRDWLGSHHQLAMQPASEQTVLGDFSNHSFKAARGVVLFYRREGSFWIKTHDREGRLTHYPVAYTFGVAPLQQYLLQLPQGKLQAFDIAWDTQQHKWFELTPGQSPDDPLHWLGRNQNANFMCIDCHSTGFKRHYDAQTDSYNSGWHAPGVGCQSCHGPAGEHLQWTSGNGVKDAPAPFARGITQDNQVQVCGRCHSRRAMLTDGYTHSQPLMDDYLPHVLTPILNEIDGKIRDEVFEYGSFVQSRMHAAGVVCSDCHQPHSGALRAQGNALCTRCHNPEAQPYRQTINASGLQAKAYDSPGHHRHAPGSEAAQCISCHMPGRYYMVKDWRHDHSFSVPNPVQAGQLGHSDACLNCHQNLSTAQLRPRYDSTGPRDGGYATALYRARQGQAGAAQALFEQLARTDLPAIRRATLIVELPRYPSARAVQATLDALHDINPQVRETAIPALAALATEAQQTQGLSPLLDDPIRAVRLAAAWQLVQLRPDLLKTSVVFQYAIDEYEQVQRTLRERPEAHLNLAMLYQLTDRMDAVEPALRQALRLEQRFSPATILLAQWHEQQGDPSTAITLLAQGSAAHEPEPDVHHALGMTLVRNGHTERGLLELEKAYAQVPANSDYAYAYGIGLYDTGKVERAVHVLDARLAQDPSHRGIRRALLAYAKRAGDLTKVQTLIQELRAINPEDPLLQRG